MMLVFSLGKRRGSAASIFRFMPKSSILQRVVFGALFAATVSFAASAVDAGTIQWNYSGKPLIASGSDGEPSPPSLKPFVMSLVVNYALLNAGPIQIQMISDTFGDAGAKYFLNGTKVDDLSSFGIFYQGTYNPEALVNAGYLSFEISEDKGIKSKFYVDYEYEYLSHSFPGGDSYDQYYTGLLFNSPTGEWNVVAVPLPATGALALLAIFVLAARRLGTYSIRAVRGVQA